MRRLSVLLGAFLASVLAVPALAQVGSVQSSVLLKPGSGGLVGPLGDYDEFGAAVATVGDLDGNGVADLAVGAPLDDDGGLDRGALWILRLAADGSVIGEQKISQNQGGFAGTLVDGDRFGRRLAGVGDLDGDGVGELATLSQTPSRLWILFLNADGTVKAHRETLTSDPAFVPAVQAQDFRFGDMVALGDLDGDGLGDLALGAPRDPDGGFRAGAVWIVRLAADGSLAAAQKISQLHGGSGGGGFGGTLLEDSRFGSGLVHLGDLNGDGQRELGVTAPGGEFGGAAWILYLNAAEKVVSPIRHGMNVYGLTWPQGPFTSTSGVTSILAWLGDLDGDGQGELAMGYYGVNWPGTDSEGGIAIGRVRGDGSIAKRTRIGDGRGGLGLLPQGDNFGTSLASLGDLDGDGSPELAVGAPYERAAGLRTGAVWILSLDPDVERNGSGVNPAILSETAEPVFGTSWTATLDCSAHAPGMAFVFGYSDPLDGIFASAGEVLVGGTPLFFLQVPHASGPALLAGNIPPFTVSLIDLPVHIQGLCTGAPGWQLSNALDVLLGR